MSRYFGSLTAYHGEVVFIDDCGCSCCYPIDAWDRARFRLTILTDDRQPRLVVLDHVRGESFTGTRGIDAPIRNVGTTAVAA